MTISELIPELEKALEEHGDLEVYICKEVLEELTTELWGTGLVCAVVVPNPFGLGKVVSISGI